ncbi:MAG: DNA gyrase subunit A [Anaerolineae bacterium]|nr:DNA gyrase subunit A [Anaerolineae bacterium]
MRGSFLDYAMSVIVARALPDARDGLKPVHRRILYAMYDMGIRAGTAYKKSARIVGEVLGKYHPHGDSAAYDAMARMAQDFSLRYMLVDGQGNFGSMDGDSPAAMRYTEARMSHVGEELMQDITMDTVNFGDNYDGTQQEPLVLPARIPNLLANGASGIAVGMATNIPPHNLRELAEAVVYLLDHYDTLDDITVDDLMQFVKGPDFPTGAEVIANEELKEAYATGKGRVVMRATSMVEEGREGMLRLVFTSFPYQISKLGIIEKIVSLVREGRLDGVRDLRDESDRNGQRLVIELKRGAQPITVLNRLYKYTGLQSTFSIQMLALTNGEPRTLSLKRSLSIFIEHRYEVIVRRSQYELDKKRARAHILEGLLKALSSLDAIIQTIRASEDTEDARTQLMGRFDLTQPQADAILEMQLRRLAALERQKITDEFNDVMARVAYLEDLLASPVKIRAVIREDILDVAEKYGDKRRTSIVFGNADFDEADLVREEEVVISLTHNGYVKRVPAREYKLQKRGGKGMTGMTTKEEDVLVDVFSASSLDTILFFSTKGKVYSQKAYRIPETSRSAKGLLIHSFLPLDQDERITAVVNIETFERPEGSSAYFVLCTRGGKIKRVDLEEFKTVRSNGLIAMVLGDDDVLGWAKYTDGQQEIIISTENGQSIRFREASVRVMGRAAGGVNAIRLEDGDHVAGMDVICPEHTHVLVLTRYGYGKRTPLEEYRTQGRYGNGIRTISRNEKTGPVVAVRCITEDDGIVVLTKQGVVLRTSLNEIREAGRNTQGVRIIRIGANDEVAGMALLNNDDEPVLPNGTVGENGVAALPEGESDTPEVEAQEE